jgi:hypothetical protein
LLKDAGREDGCSSGQRIADDEGKGTPWEKGPDLIITDPLLGDFAIDENFTLELLDELLYPPEIRQRLPNGGWRKVSLRILIALLRCGAIRIAGECSYDED